MSDITELRHALIVAANRYHELHLRILDRDPNFHVENEAQFRFLIESTLRDTDHYDTEYRKTNQELDWKRRGE